MNTAPRSTPEPLAASVRAALPARTTWLRPGRVMVALALSLLLAGNLALARAGYALFGDVQRVRADPYGLRVYGDTPLPPRTAGVRRVLMYGDSRAQMWVTPARVGALEFVNRGIGSQSTAQILGRFEQDLAALAPDVVVLELGINDLKTIALFPEQERAIVARTEANIAALVQRARGLGTTVVLVTVFPVGPVAWSWLPVWSARVPAAVKEVNAYLEGLRAPKVKLLHADQVLLDQGGEIDARFALDMLHLTPAAYAALNEQKLLPLLAELE